MLWRAATMMPHKLTAAIVALLALSALAVPAEARKVKKYVKPIPTALQKSCDKGKLKDCVRLGWCTIDGYCGTTQDVEKAGTLFKQACDGSEASGCSGLGRKLSYYANDLKQDASDALTKGCDGGDPVGCYWLGRMTKDIPKKNDFMKKAYAGYLTACDAGDAESCDSAADMNRNSHQDFYDASVPWDEDAATKLYTDACGASLGSSCSQLGGQYEEGRGVTQSYKKAKQYYQQGCTLGDSQGCDWLDALKKNGW